MSLFPSGTKLQAAAAFEAVLLTAASQTADAAVMSLRRLAINLGIVGYVGALGLGLALHGLNMTGKSSLPAYFVVWDMFCHWNGYESRVRYVGEGVSGQRYELQADALGPYLHGPIARDHYDFFHQHGATLARSVADRTAHEPLTRVFLIEEHWSKQTNLSPTLYEQTHGQPWHRTVHRQVREVISIETDRVESRESWLAAQTRRAVMSNPVLKAEQNRGRPVYAVSGR